MANFGQKMADGQLNTAYTYGTAQRQRRTRSLLSRSSLERHPLESRNSSKSTHCISSTESLESAL